MNKLEAPTSSSSDAIVMVDKNGTPVDSGGIAVNALGGLLGTLKAAMSGTSLQDAIDASVNNGDITLLVDFQTGDFTNTTSAGFQVFIGSDVSPAPCTDDTNPATCGQQFDGSGMFTVTPNTNAPVDGKIINGKFDGGPGTIDIQFAVAIGSDSTPTPLNLDLQDARIEMTGISATGVTTGIIGGAISQSDINTMLIPSVATQLEAQVMSQCTTPPLTPPTCGCPSGSTIAGLLTFFAGGSCTISADTIANNPTVAGFLAPDVALNGSSTTNGLSAGFGITAVPATFTVSGE